MGRRKTVAIPAVSTARMKWLLAAMRSVKTDLASARTGRSWSAVSALHRQLSQLRAEYDREVGLRQAEADKAAADAGTIEMTPEERAVMLQGLAKNATDDELDLVVAEWCDRKKYSFGVDATGALVLVRHGLKLVGSADVR